MDRPQNPASARSQPRLLDQVRDVIRRLRFSIRTEQGYVDWIRRLSCSAGSSSPRRGVVAGRRF